MESTLISTVALQTLAVLATNIILVALGFAMLRSFYRRALRRKSHDPS